MVTAAPGSHVGPNYKCIIRSVEVAHEAAVACFAKTDYCGCDFIEFLTLNKIDGKWLITNMTYTCTGLTAKP